MDTTLALGGNRAQGYRLGGPLKDLQGATGLLGWVVPLVVGQALPDRLVLGSESRGDAASRADTSL